MAEAQEPQVASIDEGQEHEAKNDWQLINVEGIDKRDDAAPEAQIPENWRNDQLLAALGVKPLDEKPRPKENVAE